MTAESLYRASLLATMASRGILRRCPASCSSCASFPSTSNATLDLLRSLSGSSARGISGCGSGSIADECKDAGIPFRIRQLEPSVVRQSGLAMRERIASNAFSDQASAAAADHGGWWCATQWMERLCSNFAQIHEMRKLLSTNFGHQALGTVRGQKIRAPRGCRIDPTEPFSSAANGIKFGLKLRLSQWQGNQNGSVWFMNSTVQSQGSRNLSSSTSRDEGRRRRQELTDSDSQLEHTEEEDLDYYMKSRYDQESLKSDETESETESEEELSSEPAQSEELEEDLLWKLKPNKKGKFDNVVAVLGDPRVLAAAHERLNVRRRNWTLASNELEISHVPKENRLLRSREIDYNWFKEAAYQLQTGSYSFKPVKRLDIARRGRGEARQWVFVPPKDQVVQEAIRGILERIYEPIFSVHDFGFRPGSSVHAALKSVKYGWKGISWFLQFDIRITDHNSVQKRLLKLLGEQIEDEVFLDALRQMFKVGTIWIDTSAEENKPEGSVLSPMLGNIYFHHLDLEISRIREEIKNESQV
ncbi:hypothetical protein M758_6G003700 [Ceratodon purpureus]|nr:hypothetical protein M758_6G003700 [Ceratodon purpureus]